MDALPSSPPHPRRTRRPPGAPAPGACVLVALALVVPGALVLGLVLGPPGGAAGGSWAWPLSPRPAVVGDWSPPAQRWHRGHRGVDLAAGTGAVVRAPADGTVSFAGRVVDRPVLTLDHGGGLRSSFEPVESTLRRGDRVRRGQAVGTLRGRDHCVPGDCLHWGVRRGEDYVNPLGFVGVLWPSVLLPVPGALRAAPQPPS
ncbi:M23 family metallopeptidase [Kocuria sp. U4B]